MKPKVAIVCDFLTKFGGAQQVLLSISELYPEAPIFCLLYDEEGTLGKFKNRKIIPSSLQKKPAFLRNRLKFLLPSFPKAIEEFDLSEYDVVISSNDSFAHGAITKPDTFHICYCHTPMRYAWDWCHEYLKESGVDHGLKGLIARILIHNIRIWDRASSERVDSWIANSDNVKQRIRKYYRQDSSVIYPPVSVEEIKPNGEAPEDFYLIASRLEPYKKIDLAVEAFNQSGRQLIVVGEGSQFEYLSSIAKKNVQFVGPKYGQELYDYFARAKAFIFPGEDDFGITPVESMAAGRPVIAYKKGGTLETIIPSKTGIFFEEQTIESLNSAIQSLEQDYSDFTPEGCRSQAEKFSKEEFKKMISDKVVSEYKKYIESNKK
ncbi:MAG: glycosyltransferase [Patescibacteria group bacterium]